MPANLPFDNSYARLPERFFARVAPAQFSAPRLLKLNRELAEALRLDADWLASKEGVTFLSGQMIAEGSGPVATAYAGHQFGNFVPQLGDGRAILLGEVIDRDGVRRDIQLKGAGPNAVFARRRWPGGAWPGAARIHRQRGHGGARHTDHALAGGA